MCAFFLKRLIAVRLIRLILISLRSNDFFAVFVPVVPIPLRPFGRDLIPTSLIGERSYKPGDSIVLPPEKLV